jgi:3-hydroxy acid dehydrogenase / malonic semialdehyde reductase
MVILITGASSGFGLAAARLLSKNNRLILLARRKDRLERLVKELGTTVHVAAVDITDKQQVAKFFAGLPKDFEEIDVLVNNAGLAQGLDPAQDASLDDWERMVDTNIKGLLYMTHETLHGMKKRGRGLIINIGSVAGHLPYKGGNVYGATKAFVRQFSNNLRTDLLGTDIKVTNIEPGMAETEFASVRFKGDAAKAEAVYAGYRPLQAEDIAKTIAWVIDQPLRVNIDNIEIMPLDHTYGGSALNKTE